MSFNSCTDIETKKIGDVCNRQQCDYLNLLNLSHKIMATLTFCGVEYCKGWSNLLD